MARYAVPRRGRVPIQRWAFEREAFERDAFERVKNDRHS